MTIETAHGVRSLYERRDGQRVTVDDIQQAKQQGERFVMLTAYDTLVAGVFDRVGVPLLLVGDTSGQVMFGYRNTVPSPWTTWCRWCRRSCAAPVMPWSSVICRSGPTRSHPRLPWRPLSAT